MKETYRAVEVGDNVYWVGAVDWGVRDFHGYLTSRGTTYNAFLILADKITLIDTVKVPFKEEMLARIASVANPSDISYIISNHTEMDHSGSLPWIVEAVQPEKVFASVNGVKAIADHFHMDREIIAVKDGETLSIGNMTLTFLETKMLHWPDSMFTYLGEKELLFSSDAFGMHLASSERFADELDASVLECEAAKYYANILLPLSPLVTQLLDRVGGLGITINTIAPDHGPVWRKDVSRPLNNYAKWAAQKPTNKAAVVYDTMWESTAAMARAIGEGLTAGGTSTRLMPLRSCHRSDVATEILDAGALVVGSPTMNNNMFPTVADTLTYLKGLKPKNMVGATFGSYGWSGEAVKQMTEMLAAMNVEVVHEGIRVRYVPDRDALAKCRSLGQSVAARLAEICK
jgi:flavorubredoxin